MNAVSIATVPPKIAVKNLIRIKSLPLPRSSRGFSRGLFLLTQPSAFQNIGQRVIRFVTGVFVNVCVGGRPGVLAGPRLAPGLRVIDGKAVKKRSIIEARDALDHVHVFRRSPETRLVRKIRGIDNEGVAFPMTD